MKLKNFKILSQDAEHWMRTIECEDQDRGNIIVFQFDHNKYITDIIINKNNDIFSKEYINLIFHHLKKCYAIIKNLTA